MSKMEVRIWYGPDGKGKLVRDGLDAKLRKDGREVKSRKLDRKELPRAILDKIPEDLDELVEAFNSGDIREEMMELADLLALIDSYIKVRGFDLKELEKVKERIVAEKGAYLKGTFIEYCDMGPEVKDYEFWLAHFRKNSDRYIEEELL